MNTLVVYASRFGNTKQLAKSIDATLSAFGSVRRFPADSADPLDLKEVDILIVGSPTEGFRQMPTMRAFLETLSQEALERVSVAIFDTRINMPWPLNGSAAKDMARQLRRKGVKPLVSPESFFVQRVKGTQGAVLLAGEAARAAQWALKVCETYEAVHVQTVVCS
jgi:flavodoxin